MRQVFFLLTCIILFIFFCCRYVKDPMAERHYQSIKVSKDNKVFVTQCQPILSNLKIEGKNYRIKEAWIEHPHYEKYWGDVPSEGYCFIMSFYNEPNDSIQLRDYVYGFFNIGHDEIWFFIDKDEYKKDTVTVYYRENLNVKKKDKEFLLIKK